jgi:hypothetical protein
MYASTHEHVTVSRWTQCICYGYIHEQYQQVVSERNRIRSTSHSGSTRVHIRIRVGIVILRVISEPASQWTKNI